MADPGDNPVLLVEHDPRWAGKATHLLAEVRTALADLTGAAEARFDHIGSTAVPGLAAKPFLDLQVRILESNLGKPDYDDYTRAKGAYFDRVQAAFTRPPQEYS